MPMSGSASTSSCRRTRAYPPSAIFWDPVLTLTWAAACTSRVGLGTSVLVLPMRHPLPLAKELATLQNLSEGRLILGAGVGWLEAEFDALGVPFRERGRRMDEGIAMMRAVWSDDPVIFPAQDIPAVIDEMRMLPKPEKPIPIWIGGTLGAGAQARAAARRLARLALHARAGGADRAPAARRAARARISRSRCAMAGTAAMTARCARGSQAYEAVGVEHVLVEPSEREIGDWLAAVERDRARRRGDAVVIWENNPHPRPSPACGGGAERWAGVLTARDRHRSAGGVETDEARDHDQIPAGPCRDRHGPGVGGRAARLRRGVGRRGLRHRRGQPGRLGPGAHQPHQGRHQHHADAGAHPGLRGDDRDDACRPCPATGFCAASARRGRRSSRAGTACRSASRWPAPANTSRSSARSSNARRRSNITASITTSPIPGPARPGSRKPLRSIIHGDPSLKIYTASVSPAGLRTAGEVADGVLPFFMSPEKAEAIIGPISRKAAQGRQIARPRRFRQRALCPGQHGRRSREMPRCAAAPVSPSISAAWGRARPISTTIWRKRIGYEAAAAEIQDLFLAGKREEAAAAVPDALIDETSLVGPPARIRDRLQAWQDVAANNWVGSLVLAGADAAAMRVIAEAVL